MDVNVNIRKAKNGYILRYDDPKIVERNKSDDDGWEDPSVEVVTKDASDAIRRVRGILMMLAGEDEVMSASFDSAFEEAMDDE